MKKILLVLPYQSVSDRAIARAVGMAAAEKASIVALYLIEGGAAESVFEAFSDIGFIGDRPSEDLSRVVMKEARQRGYETLGRVQVKAMEEGVSFEPLIEECATAERVLAVVSKAAPDRVVVIERKKRAFFKYFKRSLSEELADKAPCEVAVIVEEWDEEKEDCDVKGVD